MIILCYLVFENHITGTVIHCYINYVTYMFEVQCTSNYSVLHLIKMIQGKHDDYQYKLTENVRHPVRTHFEI